MAKKKVHATIQNENEMYKLIKIFLILLVCFFIFYGITYFITEHKKESTGDGSSSKRLAAIQYDKVLIGTMLEQKRDEYYVLLVQPENEYYDLYNTYLSNYATKDDALKIYTVEMNDPFNKDHWASESNTDVSDVADFKISDTTLIKVKNSEITDVYEGYEKVKSKLDELVS